MRASLLEEVPAGKILVGGEWVRNTSEDLLSYTQVKSIRMRLPEGSA